ncbi:uncharacterized protein LOC110020298 [Phalaenopsis equestris]|uniref:uncharacterized protein LOC110020298 n=1 Tax=Phalaenopsis equestris TaxID=78828 RepID=UPI0009E4AB15|nr:uncharacterized protein LOC110020298 [Phalaenopsis equestris]
MLLAAPPKPLLSAWLVPPSRLPSSSSCTGPDRVFSPISSSAVPNDPSGGDDRATGTSSRKSKVYPAGGALRGSDVLLAMHEAVARKEGGGSRVQRSFRKGKKRRESKSGDDTEQLLRANYDYGSIRPIEIRSDWMPRMEEFERRIQELRSRYHY